MSKHTWRPRNAGQSLAILAVTLPVIIGMAGLGTDGGNLYLNFRNAQSAADLAALAGARILPQTPAAADYAAAEARAISVAAQNGYSSGVTAIAPYVDSSGTTQPNHVEVFIGATVQTYFLPILGISSMPLDVRAVAGSTWNSSGGSAPAVFAGCDSTPGSPPTCPDSDKALEWSGSDGDVIGGTISNCAMTVPGSNNSYTGGTSFWNRSGCAFTEGGSGNGFSPAHEDAMAYTPWPLDFVYTDFNCSVANPDVVAIVSGKLELKNYYQSGRTLRPGIYCATGSSAEIELGDGDVTGRVTLVSQGKITVAGSNFDLTAFHSNGVLMWAGGGPGDPPTIKISGSGQDINNRASWSGIIFSKMGQVEISGSWIDNGSGGGSILGDRVKIAGQGVEVDSTGLTAFGPPYQDSLKLYE